MRRIFHFRRYAVDQRISVVEICTGNDVNLLMLKVISKFGAGISFAYAADNSPNNS